MHSIFIHFRRWYLRSQLESASAGQQFQKTYRAARHTSDCYGQTSGHRFTPIEENATAHKDLKSHRLLWPKIHMHRILWGSIYTSTNRCKAWDNYGHVYFLKKKFNWIIPSATSHLSHCSYRSQKTTASII